MELLEDAPFDLTTRAYLTLVKYDVIPATMIHLPHIDDMSRLLHEIELYDPDMDVQYTSDFLNIANFGYAIGNPEYVWLGRETARVVPIAVSNRGIAINVLRAYETLDHYELGRAYGIPESAIDSYVQNDVGVYEAIGHPIDFFGAWFAPSRNEYQEEKNVIQVWHDTIEQKTPKIYEEIKLIHQ